MKAYQVLCCEKNVNIQLKFHQYKLFMYTVAAALI